MACPNGYIEVNGNCVYAFGNESGVGPDGTPLPGKQSGQFWQWLSENLPEILIGVGTVWQASQDDKPAGQSETPAAGSSVPTAQKAQTPVWIWIALGVLVLIIAVLLMRNRSVSVQPS